MVEVVNKILVTADQVSLSATVYEPSTPVRMTALIASGIGVPQGLYSPMARWLAQQGVRCLTFDYRGICDSRHTQQAIRSASLSNWANLDAVAALKFCESQWSEPVVLIGHSFGGQLLSLETRVNRVHAAILVASQCGCPWNWTGLDRIKIFFLWYLVVPLAIPIFRVTPRWLGAELPRGVAREWAQWGRRRQWLYSIFPKAIIRSKRFAKPILMYTIEGDPMASPKAVSSLRRRFNQALVTRRYLKPDSLGVESIGHNGVFRSRTMIPVWQEMLDFLDGAVSEHLTKRSTGIRCT